MLPSPNMPSRRRLSLVNGRHTLRSRLKRALSLSSSESSNETRNPRPRVNQNSEEEYSSESNGAVKRRKIGIEADNREDHHWRPWEIQSENEINRHETPYKPEEAKQHSIIALKCVSETLANAVSHQVAWNEMIRHDLEDALSRLAAMETRMKDTMDQKKSAGSKKNQPLAT